MGAKTAIQWTSSDNGEPGASWNPIRAVNGKWTCVRASEECRFCYAATFNVRMGGPDFGPVGGELPDAARLDDKALLEPLRWKRGRRIFVGSMTDIFGSWVPDAWLDRIFAVMALTPRHTFLLLTKRPQRMKEYLTFGAAGPVPTGNLDSSAPASAARIYREMGWFDPTDWSWPGWPLPNVWLGTSIGLDSLHWRARHLIATPAAVRFLSCEPLLGPLPNVIDLLTPEPCGNCAGQGRVRQWATRWSTETCAVCEGSGHERPPIQWVIGGGESGNAKGQADRWLVRRCDGIWHGLEGMARDTTYCLACRQTGWMPKPEALSWVRALGDACEKYGIAWTFKQWGGPTNHAGGRILDGVIHDQWPVPGGGIVDRRQVLDPVAAGRWAEAVTS